MRIVETREAANQIRRALKKLGIKVKIRNIGVDRDHGFAIEVLA